MIEHKAFYEYLQCEGVGLFTVVCLPNGEGKYPAVIYRNPYVDAEMSMTEEEICEKKLKESEVWLNAGYAVVFQHCRGCGKSGGDFIPYIHEREDGLSLRAWLRLQPFYNGEFYLCGGSYLSSVHFVTAPFESDVKGAVFEVQDCERYNIKYRNGFFKVGLHGSWYVGCYKKKSIPKKNFTVDSYRMLPLSDFTQTVFGEHSEDFDEALRHPDKKDSFWRTRFGGGEAHEAIRHARIPILLVTGFYDIYTGGIFDMWRTLDEQTREMCALAVHPFDHSGKGENQPIKFENGVLTELIDKYSLKWIESVRGKCEPPFKRGQVTYYKLFDSKWCCDAFDDADASESFVLGEGEVTYTYNPYAPASFKGGLSGNFGGTAWQDGPNSRYDIISVYTPVFEEDTFIKGQMKLRLKVRSDCEDTCFYVRVSLCKEEGDYGLRDDIHQISNFDANYRPNDDLFIDFTLDDHAFVIGKGEKLRIDISSSAYPHFVPHTNRRGLFSEQTTAKIARNTVILRESSIELPIKKQSGVCV